MKKIFLAALTLSCMGLFTNCAKDKDMYDQSAVDAQEKEKIAKNVKEIFGIDFDPNQDWVMIKNGTITVSVGDNEFQAEEVQILTAFPSQFNDARILNSTKASNGETVTLNYDAPDNLETLYVAIVNKDKQYRAIPFAIGEKEVTINQFGTTAGSRALRATSTPAPVLGDGVASDNTRRKNQAYSFWKNTNWLDTIYNNTVLKKTEIDNFMGYEAQLMKDIMQAYVPEKKDNAKRVQSSTVYVNTENYFTSTGTQQEIIITPVACGGWYCGWEQLYYYYFDPAKVKGLSDDTRREYLQKLPKFKVCEMAETFADQSKATVEEKVADSQKRYDDMMNRIDKHYSYSLAYFGDENNLTEATYKFPAGYRIGFMLRIDSISDKNVKTYNDKNDKVCALNLYSDRLLNQEVNQYDNWKKYMKKDMSRASLFGANGNNYISFEDYEDGDYNDIVFQVTGGIELVDDSIILDRNVYSMAFEDRNLGDYDMNDVVIRAQRIDLTHVEFALEATGANDALFLRNIKGEVLDTITEVHKIFGIDERVFINTVKDGLTLPWVYEVIEVDKNFTFTEDKYLPYVHNATLNYDIHIARKGEDPHAIIIPYDFNYPIERICVGGDGRFNVAYPEFNNWGANKVESTDWYKHPVPALVYKPVITE